MSTLFSRGGGICRPRGTCWFLSVAGALLMAADASASWNIRQVAHINRGIDWTFGRPVAYRSRVGAASMLVFSGGIPGTWDGLYFYQARLPNRYDLVKVDTGGSYELDPGNLIPWASGDVDSDSIPELVGFNGEILPGRTYCEATMYEPPPGQACPDSLTWHTRYDSNPHPYGNEPFYITDLDQDGKKEVFVMDCATGERHMWEHVTGDSMYALLPVPTRGIGFAFGDFDQDGRTEFASADAVWHNQVTVYKCIGDNDYIVWDSVAILRPNGHDVFDARNIDGTGRATFFVSFWSAGGTAWLYQFEPTRLSGVRGGFAPLFQQRSQRAQRLRRHRRRRHRGDTLVRGHPAVDLPLHRAAPVRARLVLVSGPQQLVQPQPLRHERQRL